MAQAGMTTPEFQLTNDSNTMNLTNVITQGTLDEQHRQHQRLHAAFSAQRHHHGPRSLHDARPDQQRRDSRRWWTRSPSLLTGGNLSSAARTIITNYVANTTNYPYTTPTPTATQMRDRVRAIVHLIVTSAEYAIQK